VERAKFSLSAPAVDAAIKLIDLTRHLVGDKLSEHDSKRLLASAGVSVPNEILVSHRDQLNEAIARVGLPLAMKIQSADIPHKSEVGGVRLGIATERDAAQAFDDLLARANTQRPGATLQGVLLTPMAKRGVEIIVGTMQDATFGPMVMVGFGGVTTELFKDVIYRPAPVGVEEAVTMLNELKAAPLLHGFRGAPKADVGALAALIARISQLAALYRDEIAEIEINPVLVHPEGDGTTIVDALVVPVVKEKI
jgi:acetyltransferase